MTTELYVMRVYLKDGKQVSYDVIGSNGVGGGNIDKDWLIQSINSGYSYTNATISSSGVVRVASDVPRINVSSAIKTSPNTSKPSTIKLPTPIVKARVIKACLDYSQFYKSCILETVDKKGRVSQGLYTITMMYDMIWYYNISIRGIHKKPTEKDEYAFEFDSSLEQFRSLNKHGDYMARIKSNEHYFMKDLNNIAKAMSTSTKCNNNVIHRYNNLVAKFEKAREVYDTLYKTSVKDPAFAKGYNALTAKYEELSIEIGLIADYLRIKIN